MCFVWFSEHKAVVLLQNIYVFGLYSRDGACLQRGTD